MKEKTKEFLKKYLIGFILGFVSVGIVVVYAETYFPSNDVTYDNTESGLSSTNVQGAIDELYGVCTAEPPAGDQIIEDAGLEKDPYECRYFFTGANPNNYINFNNEIAQWRILSVECDGTIKIVRQDKVANQYWDTSGNNNWARPATLNTYLNETYYNSKLNDTAKSQIVSHDWGIGAVTDRNNDLEVQIDDEKSVIWNGKIALVTTSEFLRTNSNKEQCQTALGIYQNYKICKQTNWRHKGEYWWTLSPYAGRLELAFSIDELGRYSTISVGSFTWANQNSVLPTLYLSSDIKITGGDGSKNTPYEISL